MKTRSYSSVALSAVLGALMGLAVAKSANAAEAPSIPLSEIDERTICLPMRSNGGMYSLVVRASTPHAGQTISISFDNEDLAVLEVPETGDWAVYYDSIFGELIMPEDTQGELNITYDHGNLNFISLKFVDVIES